jgi:hypothetical protein
MATERKGGRGGWRALDFKGGNKGKKTHTKTTKKLLNPVLLCLYLATFNMSVLHKITTKKALQFCSSLPVILSV